MLKSHITGGIGRAACRPFSSSELGECVSLVILTISVRHQAGHAPWFNKETMIIGHKGMRGEAWAFSRKENGFRDGYL